MTFSYVGYIWAITGCACLAFFVVGVALALHLIGRRADRGGPTHSVESVPLRPIDPLRPVDRAHDPEGGTGPGGAS